MIQNTSWYQHKQLTNGSVKHSLWVEKYRPNSLDNYIGNDHLKSKVSVYLESGDIPHLLLFGRAGTGKTTLANLLVHNIDCDYLYINASDEKLSRCRE